MDLLPPVALSSGPLGRAQAADREIARQTALRASAVAEFARSRPASADRPQGVRGAMSPERWAARPEVLREVSEWAAPELAVALSITQTAAELLLEQSLTLVQRLPRALTALEAGALHTGHLRPLLEHVAPVADDKVRAEVEGTLLRWCAGRVTTPAELGQKARREVLRRDARAAARRLEQAIAERSVGARPGEVAGMGVLSAVLTWPEARALDAALEAYAMALPADPADRRTRGQKKADILLDLVLRPGEGEQPPVQIALTLVASVATVLGANAPGEVDGQVVPAEMARTLLRAFDQEPARVSPPAGDGPLLSPYEWLSAPDEHLSVPERAALERYWADLERRIMGDEMLGPDPLPTAAELAAWAEARLAEEPWLAEGAPPGEGDVTDELTRLEALIAAEADPPDPVPVREVAVAGGRRPIGPWRTPRRRRRRRSWRSVVPSNWSIPLSAPTPPTSRHGRTAPPGGWTPAPTRSLPCGPQPRSTGSRWPGCCSAPRVADCPTVRGRP